MKSITKACHETRFMTRPNTSAVYKDVRWLVSLMDWSGGKT